MKRNETSRRKIAAEQIAAAMKLRGLGKKQFAELMHRSPSEVTKWLSGGHNFTIALLQEISEVLDASITGVEDIARLVDGYTGIPETGVLQDPSAALSRENDLVEMVRRRSYSLGITARDYLERLVEEDIRKSRTLPKIDLSGAPGEMTRKYSGIVRFHEVTGDERFERIWNG